MPSGSGAARKTIGVLLAFSLAALSGPTAMSAPFRDATAESSIPGLKHGEGVAARDLTGDGLPELYLGNVRGPDVLMLNLGEGKFRDISRERGIVGAETIGPMLADLDGDGIADIYLVRGAFPKGRNILQLAREQDFLPDSAAEAGISPPVNGIAAFPADFDRDGDLDIFVANWGGDRFFRNDSKPGAPKFTDIAEELGLTSPSRSWGAVWADFNGDGLPDLFVARGDVGGKGGSALYFNRGGKFEKAPSKKFDRLWPMGAVATDFNGDGSADLFLPSWEGPSKLFTNDGKGAFTDATEGSGISVQVAVGASAGDMDGDLLPDLVVAGYKGPLKAFKNLGGGRFEDATAAWGFGEGKKNEGVLVADLTGDGKNDVYVASLSGGRLYVNEDRSQKSLTVRLAGPDAAVFASRVEFYDREGKMLAARHLTGSHGFCTQGPPEISVPVDGRKDFDIVVTFADGRKSRAVKASFGSVVVDWKDSSPP